MNEESQWMDNLAHLIASTYAGDEEKLTNYLGPFDRPAKDWIRDYLEREESEKGTDGILSFLADLSRLDQIAKSLGVELDEVGHDQRKHEVLKRLKVSEHIVPHGVYTDFKQLEGIRIRFNQTNDYEKMLGQGIDACSVIEQLLHSLIMFYGGFCLGIILSAYLYWEKRGYWETRSSRITHPLLSILCNYINDSKLKKSMGSFLERGKVAEFRPMIEILLHLDSYSKSQPRFASCFGREAIFSSTSQQLSRIRRDYVRLGSLTSRRTDIVGVLEEIRKLRNPIPHRKGVNPKTQELQTIKGLRPHLSKLFEAVQQFKQKAESLSLFPLSGLLIQKIDRINRGTRIEMYSELKERRFLPYSDISSLVVGAEYFFWSLPGSHKYVLVLKKLP